MALPGYLNDVAPQHALQWNGVIDELLERAVRDASQNYIDKSANLPLKVVADGACYVSGRSAGASGADDPRKGAMRADKITQTRAFEQGRGQQTPNKFIEWRDVRDVDGRLLRVEMTTETREYWAFLASVDPSQTLQLLADFARVQSIDPSDVYGAHDPFSITSTPELRKAAFLSQMVQCKQGQYIRSPYNNSERALAFMSDGANSLTQAIRSCPSLRLDRGASNKADPVGIYFTQAGKRGDLLMPDGKTPVPRRWMRMGRGSCVMRNGERYSFYQRLAIEPGPESGLVLGDLIVARTGLPVTSGADIARLVTTAIHHTRTEPSRDDTSQKARLRVGRLKDRAFPTPMYPG